MLSRELLCELLSVSHRSMMTKIMMLKVMMMKNHQPRPVGPGCAEGHGAGGVSRRRRIYLEHRSLLDEGEGLVRVSATLCNLDRPCQAVLGENGKGGQAMA